MHRCVEDKRERVAAESPCVRRRWIVIDQTLSEPCVPWLRQCLNGNLTMTVPVLTLVSGLCYI